eukprot:9093112-Pyramimonas_sp.AAC.1
MQVGKSTEKSGSLVGCGPFCCHISKEQRNRLGTTLPCMLSWRTTHRDACQLRSDRQDEVPMRTLVWAIAKFT